MASAMACSRDAGNCLQPTASHEALPTLSPHATRLQPAAYSSTAPGLHLYTSVWVAAKELGGGGGAEAAMTSGGGGGGGGAGGGGSGGGGECHRGRGGDGGGCEQGDGGRKSCERQEEPRAVDAAQ